MLTVTPNNSSNQNYILLVLFKAMCQTLSQVCQSLILFHTCKASWGGDQYSLRFTGNFRRVAWILARCPESHCMEGQSWNLNSGYQNANSNHLNCSAILLLKESRLNYCQLWMSSWVQKRKFIFSFPVSKKSHLFCNFKNVVKYTWHKIYHFNNS